MTGPRPERRSALVRHLQHAIELGDPELAALASLESRPQELERGTTLVKEGEPYTSAYVLQAGWVIRHKDLIDGRRQVVDFMIPGDLIGVEGSAFHIADESVTALTVVKASPFDPDRIPELFRGHARLGAALAWRFARDRAVLAERVMSLGRRTAYEKIAHVILELWRRLQVRDLSDNLSFWMPASQSVLADLLGLSTVHVNRTLRKMARDGLLRKDQDHIYILDLEGLVRVAEFHDAYVVGAPVPERLRTALTRP